ncbi:hypothetical protein C0995_002361 [Termitomyces sp. Mi166|nr:hypothetical protein C0995_002361 [Termitomyces sp. Mi166\
MDSESISCLIQLGSEVTVSLFDLLEAARYFTEKPTPFCSAKSTSTRDENFNTQPDPVLESIVPLPDLVEQLRIVIVPELKRIRVPANSQFVAIVHPASTALPYKRLNHLEKDNESQFEQEHLAPVFKIMAYHMAFTQIQKETRAVPGYAAVFERWASPDFQKSSFRFFASSTRSSQNITDFGICSCLDEEPDGNSFVVNAVIEVKTTRVLTQVVFEKVTGWWKPDEGQYVHGMAIQYVWPRKAPRNTNNDADGAGTPEEQTLDKILRQIWGQLIEENAEYAVLTTGTSSYYFFRRRDGSGDLYISPPYEAADHIALYMWLSAALEINNVNTDKIITPPVKKDWWDELLVPFEATGIRPA